MGRDGQESNPSNVIWISDAQVRTPSDMIAIADSYEGDLANSSMVFPEVPWKPEIARLGTVHNAGANIVFCDGHVEYGKKRFLDDFSGMHPGGWVIKSAKHDAGTNL